MTNESNEPMAHVDPLEAIIKGLLGNDGDDDHGVFVIDLGSTLDQEQNQALTKAGAWLEDGVTAETRDWAIDVASRLVEARCPAPLRPIEGTSTTGVEFLSILAWLSTLSPELREVIDAGVALQDRMAAEASEPNEPEERPFHVVCQMGVDATSPEAAAARFKEDIEAVIGDDCLEVAVVPGEATPFKDHFKSPATEFFVIGHDGSANPIMYDEHPELYLDYNGSFN